MSFPTGGQGHNPGEATAKHLEEKIILKLSTTENYDGVLVSLQKQLWSLGRA